MRRRTAIHLVKPAVLVYDRCRRWFEGHRACGWHDMPEGELASQTPLRISKCRWFLPLLASRGDAPQRWAKAASLADARGCHRPRREALKRRRSRCRAWRRVRGQDEGRKRGIHAGFANTKW